MAKNYSYEEIRLVVDTDGDGDGEAITPNHVNGMIHSVHLDYSGSADAGTDVTLAEADGAARTFLSVADNKTDAEYILRHQAKGSDGAVITGQYQHPAIANRKLKLTVAQGGASVTNCVIATIILKV